MKAVLALVLFQAMDPWTELDDHENNVAERELRKGAHSSFAQFPERVTSGGWCF